MATIVSFMPIRNTTEIYNELGNGTYGTIVQNAIAAIRAGTLTDDQLRRLLDVEIRSQGIATGPVLTGVGSAAIPLLLEQLKTSDNPIVRGRMAWILGRMGSLEAFDALVEATKDEEENVVFFALTALGRLRDPRSIALIEPFTSEHHSNRIRSAAVFGLEYLASPEAIQSLVQVVLTDTDKEVLFYARRALERLGVVHLLEEASATTQMPRPI